VLNVNNISGINDMLQATNVSNKYVNLDLSGSTFTSIGGSAFNYCTNLTSITIPDSVTYINPYDFSQCTSLTAINVDSGNANYSSDQGVLYNKVKTTLIGYPAGKTGNTFTIPNGVTSIGDSAFSSCTSLASVTIPNGVTSIGNSAFSGCTSLASVTIPNSVTSIGNDAFRVCFSLTSVNIPNSVTSIGNGAFYSCKSLASVTIPNSVTSIGSAVFRYCTSLTSVTIGNGVTSIENSAFLDCTSLTAINVDSGNANYSSDQGVLYNKAKTTLICYPAGKTGTTFTIPNGVTSIGGLAFYYCTNLASVTIGNSVTSIGESAFHNCTNLASVTIGSNVTSIGYWAFCSCTSLVSVKFEGTISSSNLDSGAFDGIGGNLRNKYLEGGIGTYTRTGQGNNGYGGTWTKQ